MTLVKYILRHTERGECQCGQCFDKGNKPDPQGHTVNMLFFKVAVHCADKNEFIHLTAEHQGEFGDCNPLDGNEHSYLELGGWIGDQGLAMQYMAAGASLGVFTLRTPLLMGFPESDPMVMQMAQMGFLSIKATKQKVTA